MGARGSVWEISVPFLQFFCKSKTLFKKKREVFEQNVQMRKRFKLNVELTDGWMKGPGILSAQYLNQNSYMVYVFKEETCV